MLFLACTAGPQPDLVVEVDLDAVVNVMRGGIGASWHAIENPIPITDGRSEGGSAWGGNPAADDVERWRQLEAHADWLGLDWLRVEVEQRMYEPAEGRFDWENREMRILDRILEWCDRRGADVLLQQMWGNVDWNTFPEWRDNPRRRVHSGPVSLQAYADGLATLVEHLVRDRRHTSIRWLGIVNEPGHGWSWWLRPPRDPMPLTPGLEAVRRALDERALDVPISGPGWTFLPPLEPEAIDFDHLIGAYDLHSYNAQFDGLEGGRYSVTEAEARLRDWASWAHDRGKPFFLSELGSMAFGWGRNHPGPGSYEAGLKDAELVIRGLGVGVDAFNRWSFVNRGDLDGQWQLVDTWDVEAGALREEFTPHPNSYFLFGMLSRFTAKRSEVLETTVSEMELPRPVFAAALRAPSGELTVLTVNDDVPDRRVRLELAGLVEERVFLRYAVTPADRDRADLRLDPLDRTTLGPDRRWLDFELPGRSVTVLTTYELGHRQGGVISDP